MAAMIERRRVNVGSVAAVLGLALLAAGCSTSAVAIDATRAGTTLPVTAPAPATTTSSTTTTTIAETIPTTTAPPPVAAAPQPLDTAAVLPAESPDSGTTLPVPKPVPAQRAQEQYTELGTIEIPKIGVSKKILEGVSLNTLDIAPGHWPGTAMPGQPGNVVIAGHRVSHDHPFKQVDKLKPGDEVIMTTADGRFVYQVTSTEIVAPDAIWIINQTADATATLFACHPPGSTRQRIVVHLALST
jgi:sortase A